MVPVWGESLEDIRWWLDPKNFFRGAPLHPPDPQVTVFMNASKEGWGAHVGQRKMFGYWSSSETSVNINVLEKRAVIRALEELDPPQGAVILVKTDNSSVVAFKNK